MNPLLDGVNMETSSPIMAALTSANLGCYHMCAVEDKAMIPFLSKYPTLDDVYDGIANLDDSTEDADQIEHMCVTSSYYALAPPRLYLQHSTRTSLC